MMTRNIFNFLTFVLIFIGLSACQNMDKSGRSQLDSAPVGSDSLRMKDSLPASNDLTQQSKVDGDGAAFMDSAAVGGMMEVDLGKLAMEKSTNPRVRAFAAQMVADHTKANTDLKAIALKLEHILPSAYPAEVKVHMETMKKLSGKQFDAHYMDMMIKDHVKTLDLFRSASSLRSEVREFAAQTLPVLEKHYDMAKEISASLK